jgi:PEGA domain
MGDPRKVLMSGLFLAISLFTAAASGQTCQQSSPANGSANGSMEQKGPDKSAPDRNKPSQRDGAALENKSGDSTQASANSSQESATQSKETAQSGDSDEKDGTTHHRSHVHLGTIGFGFSYTHFPAGFYPYYGYGLYPFGGYGPFYSPFAYGFYDPFYGPYYPGIYGGSLVYGADKGEVKLSTSRKGAQVYLDGAFAGPADKLKTMWLDPGAYNLSVSAPGQQKFEQRIYVISGKTLKIRAQLSAQ